MGNSSGGGPGGTGKTAGNDNGRETGDCAEYTVSFGLGLPCGDNELSLVGEDGHRGKGLRRSS